MRFKTLGTALTLLALAPTFGWAQDQSYERDNSRPDAYAPAGVSFDRALSKGEVEFFHQFAYTRMAGTRIQNVTIDDTGSLLSVFPIVPLNTRQSVYQIGAIAGLTKRVSVTAEVGYVLSETEQTTVNETFGTSSDGISDVSLGALFRFVETGPYRSHFSLAVSVPVGTIDAMSTTPNSPATEIVLPYPQQIGSGTVDIRPGATFEAQNQHGSFGAQVWGVSRVGENDREYRLGDRFGGTAWFAPQFTDHFSGSIRFQWETWGDVQGFDPDLDALGDQQAFPLTRGGNRLDVPVGINFYPANGSLKGVRMGAEFVFPVRHDLNGPQLGMDWGFRFRLSRQF